MRCRNLQSAAVVRVVVVALLPLMLSSVVNAANLQIDDLTEGQITLNHDANWEGGVNSNGSAYGGGVAGSTLVPGEVATFTGSWFVNLPGNPDPGSAVVYVVDPGTNDISDIIKANWSTNTPTFTATITFDIQSSPEGADLGPLPAVFAGLGVDETGGFFALDGLWRDPVTAASVSIPSNLTVQFGSVIPEPASLALLTLGGLCLLRRRR